MFGGADYACEGAFNAAQDEIELVAHRRFLGCYGAQRRGHEDALSSDVD
jgi:hypothetical protein